jgi:cytochrome b561
MLGALIALHILAGLWHLFILRDGVMRRMARFWTSEK